MGSSSKEKKVQNIKISQLAFSMSFSRNVVIASPYLLKLKNKMLQYLIVIHCIDKCLLSGILTQISFTS